MTSKQLNDFATKHSFASKSLQYTAKGSYGGHEFLQVSFSVSAAAPEGDLRSSKNTGWSLFLLPTPSQDISSDGSSWRKGLCRVQMNWHQWVLPILLKPFLFGAMLGYPLTRILKSTAFTPPQAHYTKLQVCKLRTLANKRGNFGNQFRLPESAQVK